MKETKAKSLPMIRRTYYCTLSVTTRYNTLYGEFSETYSSPPSPAARGHNWLVIVS